MRIENWNSSEKANPLFFVPQKEIAKYSLDLNFHLIAFACRLNILSMIKKAGSGHIGSSFSAIDIVLATRRFLNREAPREGIFFSSKGHDAPAIYAAGHVLAELEDNSLLTLRRMNGLPGHPETHIPGVPTNTGSLGMGISKAKGFILGARAAGKPDPIVITLLGDGELQEGQIWESMPGAARDKMGSLIAIVDGNKIQSDTWTEKVLPLGNLRSRVSGCGWNYFECNGHDSDEMQTALKEALRDDKPTFIYAHTVKASGVPLMSNFAADASYFRFHSGAPTDDDYMAASDYLCKILESEPSESDIKALSSNRSHDSLAVDKEVRTRTPSLIQKWNSLLRSECSRNEKIIALDADLTYDTGTYELSRDYPLQYIQCGIAEQDMVSIAGTLALTGNIPIVHSFASFLTTRALEQIFNNTTENTRIIYAGFLSGIVPTGPGHSHQAVIDVGVMGSIPGVKIFEPACPFELELALKNSLVYEGPSYIRINSIGIVDSPHEMNHLPNLISRHKGKDIAFVTSGVTMVSLVEKLAITKDISIYTRVEVNRELSEDEIGHLIRYSLVVVLENYTKCRGSFEMIRNKMQDTSVKVIRIGIDEIPRNGDLDSVLRWHKLDYDSIDEVVTKSLP